MEDDFQVDNKYSWSSNSDVGLDNFLAKYKPSMVQNDGTKPWIWVKGKDLLETNQDRYKAIEEASNLLKETSEKVENIKNDASIPVRSNKKTGTKSKKELREELQANATEALREISLRHNYLSGKWLVFASADKVDKIWHKLATSLVSGPLASTSAHLAKVATSPQQDNPNYQHVICVYIPNVYDKADVTEVMKILLRRHGLNLSGVKSNLYTDIGIDSKHLSGIQSTTWKNNALLNDAEIKELKDAFFAEGKDSTETAAVSKELGSGTLGKTTKAKPKPKLKRKAEEDPFVSDDDSKEDAGEDESKQAGITKNKETVKSTPKAKAVAKRNKFSKMSDIEDDAQ